MIFIYLLSTETLWTHFIISLLVNEDTYSHQPIQLYVEYSSVMDSAICGKLRLCGMRYLIFQLNNFMRANQLGQLLYSLFSFQLFSVCNLDGIDFVKKINFDGCEGR